MNEENLLKIYNKLCHSNQDSKPFGVVSVTPEDCNLFFRQVCKLAVSSKDIMQCYVASKPCVIADSDEKAANQYRKLTFIEFLEFISRLAFQLFKDTESEELDLEKKIEYMLDDIFAHEKTKRVEQVVYINEFSESDEDY